MPSPVRMRSEYRAGVQDVLSCHRWWWFFACFFFFFFFEREREKEKKREGEEKKKKKKKKGVLREKKQKWSSSHQSMPSSAKERLKATRCASAAASIATPSHSMRRAEGCCWPPSSGEVGVENDDDDARARRDFRRWVSGRGGARLRLVGATPWGRCEEKAGVVNGTHARGEAKREAARMAGVR